GNVGNAAQVAWTVDAPVVATTPAPVVTTPAPAPAPAPAPITVAPEPVATPAGDDGKHAAPVAAATFASHTVALQVAGGPSLVLVSLTGDMKDAQLVPVDADGTVHVTLADFVQGIVQLWLAAPGGTPASTSVTVDTIKPILLSAIRTTSAVKTVK